MKFFCLSLALVACSSSPQNNNSTTGGSGSERQAFEAAMNTLVCTNIATPCTNAGYHFSASACADAVLSLWGDPGASATYSASEAQLCEAISPSDIAAGNITDDCFEVYTGTLAPGANCTSDWQCATQSSTDGAFCDAGATGVCVDERVVESGAPCNQTPSTASPYSDLCDYAASTPIYCSVENTCTAYATSGVSCAAAVCGDGLYCASSNQCTQALSDGASCDPSVAYECIDADYCDPTSQKCVARLPDGTSCDSTQSDPGCLDFCSADINKCITPNNIISAYFCENSND